MPPRRRRTGYEPGHHLDPQLEAALNSETSRLHAIEDPTLAVQAVTEFFIALDDALIAVAEPRLRAIVELYETLGSYDQVAHATALSKSRVAQLYREAQRRGL